MVWIFVFGGTLAVVTLLKFLTPRYAAFLMDRMVSRPQADIEHVLRFEEPPARWRGRCRRHMKGCIRYMRTSTMINDELRRGEVLRRLEELCRQWERAGRM